MSEYELLNQEFLRNRAGMIVPSEGNQPARDSQILGSASVSVNSHPEGAERPKDLVFPTCEILRFAQDDKIRGLVSFS